ncbi:MAG: aminomethyl-transferring glycine dehydrogenase [Gammaproteobacteria bacterium]
MTPFINRHIGVSESDIEYMLKEIGYDSLEAFIETVVPQAILVKDSLAIDEPLDEQAALKKLKKYAARNIVNKSFIGQGYYNCFTPPVIQRNIFENPGWYTSYTPYQPEISQGRLEALINFQTMVCDLTQMDIANASLLDEATAAAEAMTLASRVGKSKSLTLLLDKNTFPQTKSVMKARAKPLGIAIKEVNLKDDIDNQQEEFFAAFIQYPANDGSIDDYESLISKIHAKDALVLMSTDLLALTLIKAPGEMGADIVVGNSQRFGVPLGFGGPHAAFMATRDAFKRSLPGRLVGVSKDRLGQISYRLSLQTREQHIRREKATSNICTAQALLAIMAGMYAVYHGPRGLQGIATKVNRYCCMLAASISENYKLESNKFFDTIVVQTKTNTTTLLEKALVEGVNLRKLSDEKISISLDETTTEEDVMTLCSIFGVTPYKTHTFESIPREMLRVSKFLTHPIFNSLHSETELMRYIRKLSDKDIALDRAMIPLGSCTMKLNSAAEMQPVSWPEFSQLHPFAPRDQINGYLDLINDLEKMLCEITGYSAISLQPNAGSQGEYAGLLAIDGFHKSNGDPQRNICLIPESAHGTNPASAQMAGMKVVPVKCDKHGNVDLVDLDQKASKYANELAAIMITYPSTHGVFEPTVQEVCKIVHQHGGKVYIDGANLNAMVGLCKPGKFGGDVSHLNLHKTFCIPHGGGGPGVGPIGVVEDLVPFLPSDPLKFDNELAPPVSASMFGSASILPISWMYIQMMGSEGLKKATQIAILNANYIAKKLSQHYKILYTCENGLVAHECILDVRSFKEEAGIEVDDIAKRLIDFGFHAPTMSFPVAGTLMIEPTESESLAEIDRFCNAMIKIKGEITTIRNQKIDLTDNPLKNAPHCAIEVTGSAWSHNYSRETAAYPDDSQLKYKYWPPVSRIDNVYGDRNLMCSCPSVNDFIED